MHRRPKLYEPFWEADVRVVSDFSVRVARENHN